MQRYIQSESSISFNFQSQEDANRNFIRPLQLRNNNFSFQFFFFPCFMKSNKHRVRSLLKLFCLCRLIKTCFEQRIVMQSGRRTRIQSLASNVPLPMRPCTLHQFQILSVSFFYSNINMKNKESGVLHRRAQSSKSITMKNKTMKIISKRFLNLFKESAYQH